MGRTATLRIIFDILVFGALFLSPWWAAVLAALVACASLPNYYEILFVGMFYDFVYRPSPTTFPSSFLFLIAAAIVLFFSGVIRERILS